MDWHSIVAWTMGNIVKYVASHYRDVLGGVKDLFVIKDEIEKLLPPLDSEAKVQEIVKRQELAKNLVWLAAIEAGYNVARAGIAVMFYALLLRLLASVITRSRKGA